MASEKRLIDPEVLIQKLQEAVAHKGMGAAIAGILIRYIESLPTVDAVEVVHGRWISEVVRKPDWKGKMRDYYQAASCSFCHNPDQGHGTSNYCPNCGAKMDGGNEDGNL